MPPEESQIMASFRRNFQLKIILAVLLLVFAWILVEYTSLLYRSYQINLKKQWFIEENSRLADGNRDLEKQYEYYKTDYFFRKEAKRKLNKKEPGEKIVVLSGGEDTIVYEDDWDFKSKNVTSWYKYLFGQPDKITKPM